MNSKGFIKHTGHLYTVKNQNGFNNALYDYFKNVKKQDVRKMVNDFPKKYPISMIIVDLNFVCGRVYFEFFEMKLNNHQIVWNDAVLETIKEVKKFDGIIPDERERNYIEECLKSKLLYVHIPLKKKKIVNI